MKMEELIRSRAQQAGLAGWRGELAASGFLQLVVGQALVSEGFLCGFS